MDSGWRSQREAVTRALLDRHGGRQRREWVDHFCLFHDDQRRSATWNESKGVYFCRTCDRVYSVPQVLEKLLIPTSITIGKAAKVEVEHLPPLSEATLYPYTTPEGVVSWYRVRWGDGATKIIRPMDLDGRYRKPADAYPVYGDYGVDPASCHLVVVEGEKCVDRVRQCDDQLGGLPIRAITCGSASELRHNRVALVARIGELHPRSILLWPDNDESGLAAIRAVHEELNRQNLVHSSLAPAELGLPLKGDVVDYLDSGGSLSVVLAKYTGTLDGEPVKALVTQTVVTRDGHFMWPHQRTPTTIDDRHVDALWLETYGSMPKQNQRRDVIAGLTQKVSKDPTTVRSRAFTNNQVTWWRPASTGPTYRISAQGVEFDEDPPGIFLAVPSDDGRHTPTDVDLDGTRQDLEELLSIWQFDDTEMAMIEGWLVCAMGQLQTPILLVKSPAGTGKTTFARWLTAVIEPYASEPPAQIMRDERHFLRQLMLHPVMLVDNISRVDSVVEDILSKLVTGVALSIRPLYEDRLVETFLRRAIVLTTINYEVYKGDLMSRMVVLQPRRKTDKYFADWQLQTRMRPLIPKVRGYVMGLLKTYFAKRGGVDVDGSLFRIGDLGMVFAALGYDTTALAQQEALAKTLAISPNDPWLEAIVDLWHVEDSLYVFKTTAEVLQYMRDYGCYDTPPERSPRLARWFAEKAPFFADHGFTVERSMTNPRGYKFKRVELS